MRAIDADRLQKQFDEKSTNPNYRVNMHNIKSIISNAPTVEAIPKADYEARLKADIVAILKADMVAILEELKYELYQALCHEIHGKEDCPCTNQTTSCLATFRVCDADRAIGRVIQQKITELEEQEDGKDN